MRALLLAVKWDRLDVVNTLLGEIGRDEIDFRSAHRKVLQAALQLQRTSILEEFMGLHDFSVGGVNLLPLFTSEDKYQLLSSDRRLQAEIIAHERDIYSEAFAEAGSAAEMKAFDAYKKVAVPFLDRMTPAGSVVGDEPQGSPLGAFVKYHASVLPSPHDVFFWSVLVGDEKIMPKLWASCESPIVVALLASYLCLGVEKEVPWGGAEVHERAKMLEAWAIGVLDAVPTQEQAFRILKHPYGEAWGAKRDTLLDLAMRLGMKSFLAHRHCKAWKDLWWRGEEVQHTPTLPKEFSYTMLVLKALLPLHLILEKSKDGERSTAVRMKTDEMMAAMAMTMTTAVHQRQLNDSSLKEQRKSMMASIAAFILAAFLKVHGFYLKVHGFYQVPATKFVLRCLSHVLLLFLYGYILVTTPNATQVLDMYPEVPRIRLSEVVFTVWVFGIGADEFHQKEIKKKLRMDNELSSPFESAIDAGERLLNLALVMRWASELAFSVFHETEEPYYAMCLFIVYQVTISLDVIVMSLELLSFASVNFHFGVLVIMVTDMLQDMISFLQLFGLVIFAFSLSFLGLSDSTSTVIASTTRRMLRKAGDTALGAGDGASDEEAVPWYSTSSVFMMPVWAVYRSWLKVPSTLCEASAPSARGQRPICPPGGSKRPGRSYRLESAASAAGCGPSSSPQLAPTRS